MSWESDAELAGTLYRKAKPYTAMLVARCVEPRQGARTDLRNSPKVPASTFAEHSGITDKTVTKYLRTWDAMAADGIVPAREELTPGLDVELPDQKKWTHYYRQANPSKLNKPKPETEKPRLELPDFDEDDARTLDEAADSPRVVKVYEMAESSVEEFPGPTGDQLRRLVDSLADIVRDEDPKHAYMRCFHSVAELVTALKAELRQIS